MPQNCCGSAGSFYAETMTTHGTKKGYAMHLKDKTPPCTPCRAAAAAYMRFYRMEKSQSLGRTRGVNAARRFALSALALKHITEYKILRDRFLAQYLIDNQAALAGCYHVDSTTVMCLDCTKDAEALTRRTVGSGADPSNAP